MRSGLSNIFVFKSCLYCLYITLGVALIAILGPGQELVVPCRRDPEQYSGVNNYVNGDNIYLAVKQDNKRNIIL